MAAPTCIGELVKLWREQRGLTQRGLGELLARSQAWISNIENGWQDVGREEFARLADALAISDEDRALAWRLPVRAVVAA